MVALFLDTFHDKRHAFAFLCESIRHPGAIRSTRKARTKTTRSIRFGNPKAGLTHGYAVLITVPSAAFVSEDQRADLGTSGSRALFPPRTKLPNAPYYTNSKEGFATQTFATLEGLEHVSPGRNMQFIPYGVFGRSHFLNDTGLRAAGIPRAIRPSRRTGYESDSAQLVHSRCHAQPGL